MTGRPRLTGWPRIRVFLYFWAAVVFVPLLGGKLVHLAFAALAAAVFTVVWWWVSEVGALIDRADWEVESAGSSRGRGADPRVSRLQRQVQDVLAGNTSVGSDVVLAQSLVQIIEQRVVARHGVDATTDPRRYTAIVGPDLDEFVRTVAAGEATVRARQLPALIDRIERL